MKVNYAELKDGARMTGGTFTTLNQEKCRGITMTWEPQGLVVTWKSATYIIPITNVKIVQLTKEGGTEVVAPKRGRPALTASP